MQTQLNGKVALVTGGTSGIGRAAAVALAREGAKVVVASRRQPEGAETVKMITGAGCQAIFVETDVAHTREIQALVARTVQTYGRLDVAFNNAGIEGTPFVPAAEYDEETWDRVLNVNLKAVWLCMKYEIAQMLKNGGGSIVNMSSVAGLAGTRVGVAYTASKHGVIGLTRAAAVEYATQGIRINAVCPAVIQTRMGDDVIAAASGGDARVGDQLIKQLHPLGRVGTAEEVAEAVVWLSSNAASYVTGHALPIDGGFTTQ